MHQWCPKKLEFFIKTRAACFAPSFLQKEEHWREEDGCKLAALILGKNYHFYRTLLYVPVFSTNN